MYKLLRIVSIFVFDILSYVNAKVERTFMVGVKYIDHRQHRRKKQNNKSKKRFLMKEINNNFKKESGQETGRRSIELSEEDMNAAAELFDSLDEDGSGYLDVSEIGTFLRRIGLNPTEDDVLEMVSKVDVGQHDGKMDKKEFMKLMSSSDRYGTQQEQYEAMKNAFQKFDTEGNGFLTEEQLVKVLTSVGKEMFTREEALKMLEMIDPEEGQIDYDELATAMTEDWNY